MLLIKHYTSLFLQRTIMVVSTIPPFNKVEGSINKQHTSMVQNPSRVCCMCIHSLGGAGRILLCIISLCHSIVVAESMCGGVGPSVLITSILAVAMRRGAPVQCSAPAPPQPQQAGREVSNAAFLILVVCFVCFLLRAEAPFCFFFFFPTLSNA